MTFLYRCDKILLSRGREHSTEQGQRVRVANDLEQSVRIVPLLSVANNLKEISKLDGVSNLIGLRCFDKVGEDGYSREGATQPYVTTNECSYDESIPTVESNTNQIDLRQSDKVLISEAHSMFEVKYNTDIKVNVKIR